MISNLMVTLGPHADTTDIDVNLFRHFVLNSLRSYRDKFKGEYGELVIACDDKNNWRRQVFPYYKANRKKDRKESKMDWNKVFSALNIVRDEMKEIFPYKVIQLETAEADDVIGALVMKYHSNDKILIISGDKDFRQLQRYPNVRQYDPVRGNIGGKTVFMDEPNPERYLKEHIIRGDTGDGVPNFLSADDCLVLGVRQKSVFQKKLDVWLDQEPDEFCETEEQKERFKRNKQLVDLRETPQHIQERIIEEFDTQKEKDRSKLLSYFMEHRLKNLADQITSF
jgi:5'-3' exonuclease